MIKNKRNAKWYNQRNYQANVILVILFIISVALFNENIWELLSILLISDEILHKKTESESVNGLSICIKNNSSAIIKIWISNNSNNSIKNLSKKIIDKFGYNIIYKHNNPEY